MAELILPGDAAATDVLSGKKFSAGTVYNGTGTMPNNGAVNITPSTSNQTVAQGYHNGSGIVQGDAQISPDNIKSGVNIFGVVGNIVTYTPGGTNLTNPTGSASFGQTGGVYVKTISIAIPMTGLYTVVFTMHSGNAGLPVKGLIYKNGVAYGTEHTSTITSDTTYSEDAFFQSGDTCEIWFSSAAANVNYSNVALKVSQAFTVSTVYP